MKRVPLMAAAALALAALVGLLGRGLGQEPDAGDLAPIMNENLRESQLLLRNLALADRKSVGENALRIAAYGNAVADLDPPRDPENVGTFRYLAYGLHVRAQEVAASRTPKTALEKYGEMLDMCMDCHQLFRD
ncbi:MAG: hypothetical protein ACE5R4_11780 [Armatimonadota bacterium]